MLLTEWLEDPRKFRYPTDPVIQRVAPRALDPDPLVVKPK
jgi:hypothetical protein